MALLSPWLHYTDAHQLQVLLPRHGPTHHHHREAAYCAPGRDHALATFAIIENMESAIAPYVEKANGKRVVDRRCEICDRGHMCFATAKDLDIQIMESPPEISLGSVHRLEQDVYGSWRGVKTLIPDGTKVVVKNLHTEEKTGGLRAMIELPNGDTQWINATLLGPTIIN